MRKLTLILTGLVVIGFIGTCAYFVGGVSATSAPIKKYMYRGSVEGFGKILEGYAELDSDFKYKISRRDSSNIEDDGGRDIDIEIKRHGANITYGLVCENVKSDNGANSELDLVEAYDNTNNLGGYGIKATGIKNLLDYFDSNFLAKFRKDEHAIIAVKKEGFFERIHIY